MKSKIPFSERINEYLREPEGETFKAGKWRFWFPLVIGLTALNSAMTVAIFGVGNIQVLIGAIVGLVGALLCWLNVGNLHYSDVGDVKMAARVSLLDSATLIFVIAHFCFLLWALGHLITLRSAEVEYRMEAEAYNVKAEKISSDNIQIAEAATAIAKEQTKAERLRNDTAYQTRRAVEAGARIPASRRPSAGISPALSTSPVELERPRAPIESSAAFLSKWDVWIRVANFGELILAAVTLIYIRNRSARHNAPYLSGNGPRMDFQGSAGIGSPVATVATFDAKKATPVATVAGREVSLKLLREHLGVIASYMPNRWFRADLIDGGVSIRLYGRNEKGRELTIKQTRQSDKLLAAVSRPDFRERLVDELIHQGFPIGGQS